MGRGRRRQGKRGNQQRSPGRSDRPLDTLVSPIACKTEDQLFTIATIATFEDLIRGSLGVQRHRLGEGSGEGLQTVPSLGRGGAASGIGSCKQRRPGPLVRGFELSQKTTSSVSAKGRGDIDGWWLVSQFTINTTPLCTRGSRRRAIAPGISWSSPWRYEGRQAF